jgi:type I restriction enzyme, S subunit
MEFKSKCLHEVCNITSSRRIFKADYQPEGIPFYRAKEISEKHNGKGISDRLFIGRDKFETLRKKFGAPQDGDLLLTSIGALLGEPYVLPIIRKRIYLNTRRLSEFSYCRSMAV